MGRIEGRTLARGIATVLLLLLASGTGWSGEEKTPRILPHEPLVVAPSKPRPAAAYRHVAELVARLAKIS